MATACALARRAFLPRPRAASSSSRSALSSSPQGEVSSCRDSTSTTAATMVNSSTVVSGVPNTKPAISGLEMPGMPNGPLVRFAQVPNSVSGPPTLCQL